MQHNLTIIGHNEEVKVWYTRTGTIKPRAAT